MARNIRSARNPSTFSTSAVGRVLTPRQEIGKTAPPEVTPLDGPADTTLLSPLDDGPESVPDAGAPEPKEQPTEPQAPQARRGSVNNTRDDGIGTSSRVITARGAKESSKSEQKQPGDDISDSARGVIEDAQEAVEKFNESLAPSPGAGSGSANAGSGSGGTNQGTGVGQGQGNTGTQPRQQNQGKGEDSDGEGTQPQQQTQGKGEGSDGTGTQPQQRTKGQGDGDGTGDQPQQQTRGKGEGGDATGGGPKNQSKGEDGDGDQTPDDPDDPDPDPYPDPIIPGLPPLEPVDPLDLEAATGSVIGVTFRSGKHVFTTNDILGNFRGETYADDPTIIDTDESDAGAYTDKDGNKLYAIDSAFGFNVQDFIGATQKEHDASSDDFDPDYSEGWAGNIVEEGEVSGIALRNAMTDTFKSGQPLGTWAAGLGGNKVKASTEHYNVMASLLSDQAYAADPDALYTIDNNLKVMDLEETADGSFVPGALHGLYVDPLTDALEHAFAKMADAGAVKPDLDFDGDGVAGDAYAVGTVNVPGYADPVAAVDIDADGTWDVIDSHLNGFGGTADVSDVLAPNEATTAYDIAYGDDFSVTLKDDGKLLYRWGTMVKRPNDIRMDIKLELPDVWRAPNANEINDGKGFKVTKAELVVTHTITNNPNDQIRPEDYENEDAIGRKPAYYVVMDPSDLPEDWQSMDPETLFNEVNTLWVSPRNAYAGNGKALPSYLVLDANGKVDLSEELAATHEAVWHPPVYDADADTYAAPVLAGYRNMKDGKPIGTVLKDGSLPALNDLADLEFSSEGIAEGYTNEWFTTMDREPFEWSYDQAPDNPYIVDPVSFSSREEAEIAGYSDDELISGPRWRLTPNKFGQDLPGVVVPKVDNSPLPFQHDNIGYPVGEPTTTTLNLLDWDGTSPLGYSGGWTTIDRDRLDENGDGFIDEGWSQVYALDANGEEYLVEDGLVPVKPEYDPNDPNAVWSPEGTIVSAVSPNGMTLTADWFDFSVYVKGDRRDSVKIYDAHLVLEYEIDPGLAEVYDYGDAPDDAESATFYQYGADGDLEAARAQILPGFYLGAPVDNVEVFEADIDAEEAPLTDLYALGDDMSYSDDEGNAMTFLTPLVEGVEAWMEVAASVPDDTSAYLYAWFDLDGDGVWDGDEMVFDGTELTDGTQLVSFNVPAFNVADMDDGKFFARFILADQAEGVEAYGDGGFYGEIEDVLVNIYSPYDDITGRDGDAWWTNLSDGDSFHKDNYGKSQPDDWDQVVVADLNGDGIDDIAGHDEGNWIAGVTVYDFDPNAYDPDNLPWRFDFSNISGQLKDPDGDIWALDMDGDGADEIIYRDAEGKSYAVSYDDSFDVTGRVPNLPFAYYEDMLVGDFDGDGREELAGLRLDSKGAIDNWWTLDQRDDGRITLSNWGGSWKPDAYEFVVGDFNADGKDDIAGRDSDGHWIVSLTEATGGGGGSTTRVELNPNKTQFTSGKNWTKYDKGVVLGGGDADGDGDTDVIVYDEAQNQFMVGMADPEAETFAFTQFGGLPQANDGNKEWVDLRLGDFNGDGLIDVAARDAHSGTWTVAESDGTAFVEDPYGGTWDKTVDWQNVMVGNFDAMPEIVDAYPDLPDLEEDDKNGKGKGAGDGTGDGSGQGSTHGDEDHGNKSNKIAPTPPDESIYDLQEELTPDFTANHVFSINDVLGGFHGQTVGDGGDFINYDKTKTDKEGNVLYAVDNEFGFHVTDFIGAVQKDQENPEDWDYGEGWAANLLVDGEHAGLLVSNAKTAKFNTPNVLGTWLVGMGGSAVKASTEHYTVMQKILSDQAYPGDPDALLPLDDDLRIIDYKIAVDPETGEETGQPELDGEGNMVEGAMHNAYVKELLQAFLNGEGTGAIDFNRDGTATAYETEELPWVFDGVTRDVLTVDLGDDGTIDYVDGNLNGFGTYGIADVLEPNESSAIENIAYGDDYSVTLKDDGKLLFRWGNLWKRPNDMRMSVTMDLPDDWTDTEGGLRKLYKVTDAELIVNHTVTNNPNDQIRPEDHENEAAIGHLPTYEVVDGKWVSTNGYYAGDGTYYAPDTVLRDPELVEKLDGSLLEELGLVSSDHEEGFTNEWYTTMDREPFVAVYDENGDYVVGPRFRLQPDKYGQDLPGVIIPQDPAEPLPVRNGEEKYEVGLDTTTVLNLLDWNGPSPLSLSAGWLNEVGVAQEVSGNGLMMTNGFDVAFYVKGDQNPVKLYDAELRLSYEAVTIHDYGADDIEGTPGDDALVGQGGNTFEGGAGADIFLLGYGETDASLIGHNTITDFSFEEGDAVGFVGYGLDPDNYNIHITQEVVFNTGLNANELELTLDGSHVATLTGLETFLEADEFYFA